jgi:hypothetical protein
MLILKFLQMKSSFGWSLCNLAALRRAQAALYLQRLVGVAQQSDRMAASRKATGRSVTHALVWQA